MFNQLVNYNKITYVITIQNTEHYAKSKIRNKGKQVRN